MANIETIRAEVEKLTPECCRIDEEVYNRLEATAKFFEKLGSDVMHDDLTLEIRKSASENGGWLRVVTEHIDIWQKEMNEDFFKAMSKADVYEIYAIKDYRIAIDISFNNLYVREKTEQSGGGMTDYQFKTALKAIYMILESSENLEEAKTKLTNIIE